MNRAAAPDAAVSGDGRRAARRQSALQATTTRERTAPGTCSARISARVQGMLVAVAFVAVSTTLGSTAAAVAGAAPAGLPTRVGSPSLQWRACGDGFECAAATVPRDYQRPLGAELKLAVVRRPATDPTGRIGSLFLNPGGPGGSGVDLVRGEADGALSAFNRHFDLVGFDPRGVGSSDPAVKCLTDDEAKRQFSAPFPWHDTQQLAESLAWAAAWTDRCVARNRGILRYLSTANVARDLDVLRAAVGDPRLSYIGFSYGTLLGATYASLFPDRVRALVLDGAVDPDVWINRPLEATQEQLAGFERALHRFFAACARRVWCDYGGDDPEEAFDRLVMTLDRHPVFASPPYDSRPVTGQTLLVAAAYAMDSKPLWSFLAAGLVQAEQGRGTVLRALADLYWGISADGAYDGVWDRNLAVSALDQRFPRRIQAYMGTARHSDAMFPHFGWSSGFFELPWRLFPVRPRGVFRGPFRVQPASPTALVIGTTYDPATPYAWAKRLTAQLGNARLLTMVGDGHTSLLNYSACIESAVATYLEALDVPADGAECGQDLPARLSRRSPTESQLHSSHMG
jgi:pimeloyl-ACP methyl ester carboxylesterase